MSYPVTAITAAVCALLLLLLAVDTVRQRLRAKAAFGDAGDARLISAMRSHGNLAEHAPLVIILIGLLEGARVHHYALTGVATLFLVARALHIWGLYLPASTKAPLPRQLGVMGTWASLAILSVWTLLTVVRLNF